MNKPPLFALHPNWTTRRVILATLCVAAIGLGFFLLFRLRSVVFLFSVAVVLGTVIRPAVNTMQKRGVLRPVGIFAVYMILGLSVFGFMVLVVPLVADQAAELSRNVPEYYENLRAALLDTRSRILTNLALNLPASPALFAPEEGSTEETLTQVSQTYLAVSAVVRSFLGMIAVLLLGFYWALEGDRAIHSLLQFVPPGHRGGVRDFIALAEQKLGGFIRGQGILALVVAAAAGTAYALIGLPFAFVLALIAGIFELVPFFGPALGAIPALLVSLTFDPATIVWVLVATGAIQLLENVWLVPRVMNHSMGVHPIVTLLSLVTFSSVLGFAGAVLALPLAAVIQLALDRLTSSAAADETGAVYDRGAEIDSIAREYRLILRELETEAPAE